MAISLPGERTSRASDRSPRGPARGDRGAVASFQLHLLGSPRLLYRSGAPVRWRTKKHLAVLVYLHLEGRERPVRRDALAELLWPDAPAAKGRHSLSQALVAIRERLGAEALTRREHDVRLLAPPTAALELLRAGGVAGPSRPAPLLAI